MHTQNTTNDFTTIAEVVPGRIAHLEAAIAAHAAGHHGDKPIEDVLDRTEQRALALRAFWDARSHKDEEAMSVARDELTSLGGTDFTAISVARGVVLRRNQL